MYLGFYHWCQFPWSPTLLEGGCCFLSLLDH
jgi:hypothetical protein